MRHLIRLALAEFVLASFSFAQSAAPPTAPQLSPEQKEQAAKIINGAKEH